MSDWRDDAVIIALGRALRERGAALSFAEAEPVEEGFRVAAKIEASVTVALVGDVASGRRRALETMLKTERGG